MPADMSMGHGAGGLIVAVAVGWLVVLLVAAAVVNARAAASERAVLNVMTAGGGVLVTAVGHAGPSLVYWFDGRTMQPVYPPYRGRVRWLRAETLDRMLRTYGGTR